jgi:hypothetical protein
MFTQYNVNQNEEKSETVYQSEIFYDEYDMPKPVQECISILHYSNSGSIYGNTFRGIAKGTGISETQVRRICKPEMLEKKSHGWLLSIRNQYKSRLFTTNGRTNEKMWFDALHSHYEKLLRSEPKTLEDGSLVYICNTSRFDLLVTIGTMYGFDVKYLGENNNQLWVKYIGRENVRNDSSYYVAYKEDYSDYIYFENEKQY